MTWITRRGLGCHLARVASVTALVAIGLIAAPPARAATTTSTFNWVAADGTELFGYVTGAAPIVARPTIVEFTVYGQAPGARTNMGDQFNYAVVHVRGTGRSAGTWDLMGPTTQQDMIDLLGWACDQPWSNGRLGLWGTSASGILAYVAMRHELPCVDAAGIATGTSDLYRDVSFIGGVQSAAVPAGFLGLVAAPALLQNGNPDARLRDDPGSFADLAAGFADVSTVPALHPSDDEFWGHRDFTNPVAPHSVPIMNITGWFDIESRGPVEAFMATRHLGSHLAITGGHEGGPFVGAGYELARRFYERHLLDRDNGLDAEGPVHLVVPRGARDGFMQRDVVARCASAWPLPGTSFEVHHLRTGPTGSALSLNDGALSTDAPGDESADSYPFLPSDFRQTDPAVDSVLRAVAASQQQGATYDAIPGAGDLRREEPKALTYTGPVLSEPLELVGPASLRLFASSTASETDWYAVLADVVANGQARPVAVGRLRSSYPDLVTERTLYSTRIRHQRGPRPPRPVRESIVVRPYNDLSAKRFGAPGEVREYHVELWPVGNVFDTGHRVRLYLVGPGAVATLPAAEPGVNTVLHDVAHPSSLVLPVADKADRTPCSPGWK